MYSFSIQKLRRAGILQKLREDFLSAKLIKVENTKTPADIDEVEPILAILVLGIALACIVLLAEIVINRKTSHTNPFATE
jgi:hypothetical protein